MSDKPRGRPKTLDRQRIVEVATEAYWREGIDALSLNEVVRRLDVSKPGVYREFGGEDGLMDACLAHYRAQVLAPVLTLLASARPFPDVLRDLLDAMTAPRDTPDGCLFTEMRMSPSRIGPATAARVSAIRDELRQGFEDWFRRGRARGEVDPTVDPGFAAGYVDTQIMALLAQLGLGEDPATVRAQAAFALERLLAS